jgi:16S rRNA (cytidine1402-2'-O)-methyltransferase
MKRANVYLIPNTLGGESLSDIIPVDVQTISISLRTFFVEEIRSARRLLRKMDREFPIDECTFHIMGKSIKEKLPMILLDLAKRGENCGVISEAGCPAVADPGAEIVSLAHDMNMEIVPLVGPSSILLALMGSGFSGQQFTFHGYLPRERRDRIKKLKEMEADAFRHGRTHIFMDTPFRNMHVLEDMVNELTASTPLCIAYNLTLHGSYVKTLSITEWKQRAVDIAKKPAMFLIGNKR